MKERNTSSMWLFASLLLATMLIGMQSAEAATVTIDAPAAGGTASTSTFNLSATVSGLSAGEVNVSNLTFFYSTTNGGTQVFISSVAMENETSGSVAWDTTTLTDLRTYVVYAFAYNDTPGSNTQIGTTSNANVIIDNTNPTSTYGSSTPADQSSQRAKTATFNTASDNSLDSCILFMSKTANFEQFNGTIASGVCTISRTGLSDGTYNFYIQTSDGSNQSTTTQRLFRVNAPSASIPTDPEPQPVQSKAMWLLFGVIAVIVAVILIARGRK